MMLKLGEEAKGGLTATSRPLGPSSLPAICRPPTRPFCLAVLDGRQLSLTTLHDCASKPASINENSLHHCGRARSGGHKGLWECFPRATAGAQLASMTPRHSG
jgi:hypothetical protein